MALTGGLLTFLALEALSEALELQAAAARRARRRRARAARRRRSATSALTFVSRRLSAGDGGTRGRRRRARARDARRGRASALHNLGEGLAIGSSFALGELALGTFLIVGFMVHNVTEGLGIAAPIADGGRSASLGRLAALALVAGAPADPRRLDRRLRHERRARRRSSSPRPPAPRSRSSSRSGATWRAARRAASPRGYVLGGFLAGIAIMYVTGLFVG